MYEPKTTTEVPQEYSPYREMNRTPCLESIWREMQAACQFLKEWEKFDPVIGGGAMWAWAAGTHARDVDIFMKCSFRSKRKAERLAKNLSAEEKMPYDNTYIVSDGYDGMTRGEKGTVSTYRFLFDLPGHPTPVDLVLTPWHGVENIDHFDYRHCCVGFGPAGFSMSGAGHYAIGKLEKLFNHFSREPEVIQAKVQKTLWGNPEAPMRLEATVRALRQIYQKL